MTAQTRGIDRRQALALTISAAAFTAAPAAGRVAARTPATRFAGLLAQFSEELLKLSPETATSLGLDTGARAALRSQIAGGSPADEAKFAGQVRSMLSRLGALDRASLSPADRIRYDTVKYAAGRGVEGTGFFYGSAAGGFFGNQELAQCCHMGAGEFGKERGLPAFVKGNGVGHEPCLKLRRSHVNCLRRQRSFQDRQFRPRLAWEEGELRWPILRPF